MQSFQTDELNKLDDLLGELSSETETQCELLREHLESARVYLVGSMQAEYTFSLDLAGEALNGVSDPSLRNRIEEFIQSQNDISHPANSKR